jgi:hypothetical protein
MNAKNWTRRQVLRGAGVALSLPWLETFAPRTARAQAAAAAARQRFIVLFFPNGSAAYWTPTGSGAGDAWKLSPILEPLAPVKANMLAFNNVSNNAPWGGVTYPNSVNQPAHGALGASTWTGVKLTGPGLVNNGISVDQVAANLIAAGPNPTNLHSLQVGLSTLDSFTDNLPAPHSRSMAWKSATEPLYKMVNPQAVFDRLIGGGGGMPSAGMNTTPPNDPAAMRRRALDKSALDYIKTSSGDLQKKLAVSDKLKVDQFLSSVRELEMRLAATAMPPVGMPAAACMPGTRPPEVYGVGNVPAGYNRGAHANLMIDLVVMALKCDITRVVSFMLDDARSDYAYSFLKERMFTTMGSTPGTATVGSYHAAQHAGERNNNTNNGFATIGYWNSEKAAQIASKLAAVTEGAAGTMLDNTVMMYASGMHGGNHESGNIPIAILGGGGKVLKQNHYFPFPTDKQLSDIHLTILQKVFGYKMPSFGASTGILPDILA